ncbi:uncharacterized protein K02A2.6-like isoform X1 [Uranotaenia lowii]|uniref:uncharacterized protein K02A2.6-like isoform X1 n=3 Tax=Uranotaenia lowii TaxID=190385 RepID=UPI002479A33D|nr:uncharacterized protein K02A2.6-like isoform X1 [Uranotaenia lowii]
MMEDGRPIPPFRCNQIETGRLAKEWRSWKDALECYFAAYGIMDQQTMKAKLLHLGGPALQTVFKNLKDKDHVPMVCLVPRYYDAAIEKLDDFFEPQHQCTSERSKLRKMKQSPGERFADYIIRLKQQVTECGFDKYGSEIQGILTDIYLTDVVLEGCRSNEVRRRILMKDLAFAEIEALGVSQEGIDQQIEAISNDQHPSVNYTGQQQSKRQIGKIPGKRFQERKRYDDQVDSRICFNCGKKGHISKSRWCLARGKECRKCRRYGHLEECCRQNTQPRNQNQVRLVEENVAKETNSNQQPGNSETPEKVYYAFYSGNESNVIPCTIGGIDLEMLVDSGADANLISDSVWHSMKGKQVKVKSSTRGSNKILRSYGRDDPLIILGSFWANIIVGNKNIDAEFLVVQGGQRCLLGDKTAKDLGVLKVGLAVNQVERSLRPFTKISGVQAKIRMKSDAVPVFQPMRRIPLPLEAAVSRKLDELIKRDIIEVKEGPTSWVSPLVVVGKANGEPRLCLDLRRVNENIIREHHPMPVVDDYLARLGRGKIWSKLDIREAFLQIELAEDSKDITTFITSRGLFRFKRLCFGLATAPELFQKAMDEILSGCPGTHWYLDDVIIEGVDLKEHDERLEEVQ